MARNLTAAMQAEVAAGNLRPVLFAEMIFRPATKLRPRVAISDADSTTESIPSVGTPGVGQEDMLDWLTNAQSATTHFHNASDPATNPIYTLVRGNKLWHMKGAAGHPWDLNLFDDNYVYWWITEDGDEHQWANDSAYKRNDRLGSSFPMPQAWPLCPRFFNPATDDGITIDSPAPNHVHRTVSCETDGQPIISLGSVKGITRKAVSMAWGGSVGTQPTMVIEYYYGGGSAFGSRERYFCVKNIGVVRWDVSSGNFATNTYTVHEFHEYIDRATGGSPTPDFPCAAGASWWIDDSLFPSAGGPVVSGGGGTGWNDPQDAFAVAEFASVLLTNTSSDGAVSSNLDLTDFGYAVDTDKTVSGIKVEFEAFLSAAPESGLVPEFFVSLLNPNGLVTSKAINVVNAGPQLSFSLGGPTDLWSNSWTPGNLNSASFGVRIQAAIPSSSPAQTVNFNIRRARVTAYGPDGLPLDSDAVRAWTGIGQISWDGKLWTGLGQLVSISPMPETIEVAAQNVTFVLNGIPSGLAPEALEVAQQNGQVRVWFGALDESNQVIADPTKTLEAHLDVPTMNDGAETCSISITAENPLVDFNRAPNRRFTDFDQQHDYLGDLGMCFVSTLQNTFIQWPRVP